MDDKAKKRSYRGRGNGSIKSVGGHYAVTTTVHGRRQYATVKTKADAEKVIRDAREKNRSWRPSKADLKITVLEFVLIWILTLTVKDTTLASYEEKLVLYILPFFGNRILATITIPDIRTFISSLSDHGCSVKTIKNTVSVLSKMFNSAIIDGYCTFNPTTLVDIPKRETHFKPEQLMDDDYYRFFELIKGDEFEDLYFIAITTGMRRGELVELTWNDVDFEKNQIAVISQLQPDVLNRVGKAEKKTGDNYKTTSTKNYKRRSIVVSQATMDRLRRIRKAQMIMEEANLLANPKQYVFLGPDNDHLKFSTIQRHFKSFLRKHPELPQGMRFHDLRGSYITHLFDLNAPPKVASGNAGHATVAFTVDHYCMTSRRAKDLAANLMDEDFQRHGIDETN